MAGSITDKRTVEFISKLEASDQQFRAAIWLLFGGWEIAPVHTLAHASFQLLSDLGKHCGLETWREIAIGVSGLARPEAVDALNSVANALKHANKDATTEIEVSPEDCECLLFLTSVSRNTFEPKLPDVAVFQLWFLARHEQWLDRGEIKEAAERIFPGLAAKSRQAQLSDGERALSAACGTMPAVQGRCNRAQ